MNTIFKQAALATTFILSISQLQGQEKSPKETFKKTCRIFAAGEELTKCLSTDLETLGKRVRTLSESPTCEEQTATDSIIDALSTYFDKLSTEQKEEFERYAEDLKKYKQNPCPTDARSTEGEISFSESWLITGLTTFGLVAYMGHKVYSFLHGAHSRREGEGRYTFEQIEGALSNVNGFPPGYPRHNALMKALEKLRQDAT